MPKPACPAKNTDAIDQSSFWDLSVGNWDGHRIGWAIAGGCACLTIIISAISVLRHCRSYTNRREQRQILRILYMPPVYAIISFLSYRFFRHYTYYSFIEVAYEAVTLSAFLLLLIEYVASTASGNSARNAIARKDKRPLPFPLCFWRYRPTKAYFMYTVKWSVLQYVIIRPVVSIVGIICERFGVLCEAAGFSAYYASAYLESVDFVSISIALYGIWLFYDLTAEELRGRRPMAKFWCIKFVVMFTFYQSFVFKALEGNVIRDTEYWTATNISNGLDALAICIEMVFFSVLMMWAYTPEEYKREPGTPPTNICRPLWDSINFSDFAMEIAGSLYFYIEYAQGKPHAHGHGYLQHDSPGKTNFGEAFRIGTGYHVTPTSPSSPELEGSSSNAIRLSYDESSRLIPHPTPDHLRGSIHSGDVDNRRDKFRPDYKSTTRA